MNTTPNCHSATKIPFKLHTRSIEKLEAEQILDRVQRKINSIIPDKTSSKNTNEFQIKSTSISGIDRVKKPPVPKWSDLKQEMDKVKDNNRQSIVHSRSIKESFSPTKKNRPFENKKKSWQGKTMKNVHTYLSPTKNNVKSRKEIVSRVLNHDVEIIQHAQDLINQCRSVTNSRTLLTENGTNRD